MNKREAIRQNEQENRLMSLGFTREEAQALRRISMTLRRWYELECGDGNDYASWAIERDESTDIPYMVRHIYPRNGGKTITTKTRIADREKGAIKRLDKIMTGHDGLSYYLQTDPRGASLYIIRPSDVQQGQDVSACYTNGLCVY